LAQVLFHRLDAQTVTQLYHSTEANHCSKRVVVIAARAASNARLVSAVHSVDHVLCCCAVRQLQLRHCPAILSISIVDRMLQPLPGCLDVQHDTSATTADMSGGHHAVICTEDQFKVSTAEILSDTSTLYLVIFILFCSVYNEYS